MLLTESAGEEKGLRSLLGRDENTVWFEALAALGPLDTSQPLQGEPNLDLVETLRQVREGWFGTRGKNQVGKGMAGKEVQWCRCVECPSEAETGRGVMRPRG